MREIIFRGKRVDGYGWIEGDLIHDVAEHNRPRINIQYEYSTGTFYHCGAPRVITETVGQFTGLYDKNGKKIFEGDILQGIIVSSWNKEPIRCKVVYKRDCFMCEETMRGTRICDHKVCFAKNIEVIGNVYDNPELLGEQE